VAEAVKVVIRLCCSDPLAVGVLFRLEQSQHYFVLPPFVRHSVCVDPGRYFLVAQAFCGAEGRFGGKRARGKFLRQYLILGAPWSQVICLA
jgi:hypothetical protein